MVVVATGLCACDSSDCPLNNTVSQVCNIYRSDNGAALTLEDTLTVMIRDSVILNRMTGASTISLPLSYNNLTDTLVFLYCPQGEETHAADTVFVTKTNEPHFISLDCPTLVFHTISAVSWSRRTPSESFRYAIDSIGIKSPEVTNDLKENLQIFFSVYDE